MEKRELRGKMIRTKYGGKCRHSGVEIPPGELCWWKGEGMGLLCEEEFLKALQRRGWDLEEAEEKWIEERISHLAWEDIQEIIRENDENMGFAVKEMHEVVQREAERMSQVEVEESDYGVVEEEDLKYLKIQEEEERLAREGGLA